MSLHSHPSAALTRPPLEPSVSPGRGSRTEALGAKAQLESSRAELEATRAQLHQVVQGSESHLAAARAERARAQWHTRALTIGSTAGLALAAIGANLARGR